MSFEGAGGGMTLSITGKLVLSGMAGAITPRQNFFFLFKETSARLLKPLTDQPMATR
jgi:hypothetical protein